MLLALQQLFSGPKFNADTSIPDLTTKVFLVTGGNAGLGLETVLQLAKHKPARIFVTARTRAKFDTALETVKSAVPTTAGFVSFVELDLSSLASVKAAADAVIRQTDRLDVLINNAGIMGADTVLTSEGYETHFGVNHMGPALLTRKLLPLLQKTAKESGADVRIVNVSSAAYALPTPAGIDFALVKTNMSEQYGGSFGMMTRYGQSKLANVLHAAELARRYPDILAVSIHPGRVKTQLLDGMYSDQRFRFYGMFQVCFDTISGVLSVQDGALTQLWAATQPRDDIKSGSYYVPVGKEGSKTKHFHDKKLAEQLWDWQEEEFKRLGHI